MYQKNSEVIIMINKKWIFIFVIIGIIISLVSIFIFVNDDKEADNKKGSNHSYYKEYTVDEIQKKVKDKEDFTVYIYSPECSACKEFTPILRSVMEDTKTKIHAIAITETNSNSKFFEKNNLEYVPTLIKFTSGKETGRKVGLIETGELTQFFK